MLDPRNRFGPGGARAELRQSTDADGESNKNRDSASVGAAWTNTVAWIEHCASSWAKCSGSKSLYRAVSRGVTTQSPRRRDQ